MLTQFIRSCVRVRPAVAPIQFRPYSQIIQQYTKIQIPPPREDVPDVATFLEKIGRDVNEHVDVFENDWEAFWKLGSAGMKEKGIDTAARRYILDWQERYRKGLELYDIKRGKKKFGGKGERYAKVYRALKRREARIAERELRERWRSENSA